MSTAAFWKRWARKGRAKVSVGVRVRLKERLIAVDLAANTGTVTGSDIWDGYYIVRLDQPAKHHNADGTVEDLPKIREAWDNLEVLTERSGDKSPRSAERWREE